MSAQLVVRYIPAGKRCRHGRATAGCECPACLGNSEVVTPLVQMVQQGSQPSILWPMCSRTGWVVQPLSDVLV